jgi:hypothetical protein
VRRRLIREHIWVSTHLTLDEYASLPLREQAEYQLAAQKKREAMRAANPFGGGGDEGE